jgi:23S rRNA pseudouridine2605 synthase
VVTEKDPEGRETIFEALDEKGLPRVVSIGRLDINTEGLLLLTNDGGLKRVLELPATGWLRRYRVRAFGQVTQEQLDTLKDGIEIDGVQYGPIDALLEREQGSNVWLVLSLREGKNREVKNVLGALGLQVNRLIRVSYGPFQLGDLPRARSRWCRPACCANSSASRLADEAGARFRQRDARNSEALAAAAREAAPRQDRPGRWQKAKPAEPREERERDIRTVHFDDGTEGEHEVKRSRPGGDKRWDPDDSSAANFGRPAHHDTKPRKPREAGADDRPRKSFGDKPGFGAKKFGDKKFGDRPARSGGGFGDRPARDGDRKFGDKPGFGAKKFTDKPGFGNRGRARAAGEGDDQRPARSFSSRTRSARPFDDGGDARPPRKDFGDRKSFGDKKPYAPRGDAGDRPARKFGDKPAFGKKPYSPRGDGGDRPARSFGDKKPYAPRADAGDRPARTYTPRPDGGDRPARSYGDKKPYGTRPPREGGDRPSREGGDRPARTYTAGTKPAFGGKPGGKPYAGRPGGARPGGAGDKPRGPRKPRP